MSAVSTMVKDFAKEVTSKHIEEMHDLHEAHKQALRLSEETKDLAILRLYHVQETLRAHTMSKKPDRDARLIDSLYGQFRSHLI